MADGTEAERVALHDIERLVRRAAARSDEARDFWIAELADELRVAIPELAAPAAADLAGRILADPAASLGAQAHLTRRLLRVLRD